MSLSRGIAKYLFFVVLLHFHNWLELIEQGLIFKNFTSPLAVLLRPKDFGDLVGGISLDFNNLVDSSFILWGPPGVGKTSVAKILSKRSKRLVFDTSAVSTSGQEFKEILKSSLTGSGVLLLIDEIHHLNKSQQDLFLPYVEDGRVAIIGTTTENPSFELRAALLSRCKVITFNPLSIADLLALLDKAESFVGKALPIQEDSRRVLCEMASGDGRYLLNRAEELFGTSSDHDLSVDEMKQLISDRPAIYDKDGEGHYNLISALHKSMRGSDVDAALYWFARMLNGGEDPLYIARRLIRFAVEDVGMADPQALVQALYSHNAYSILGSPEGELAIAQAVVYLATAPKSNAVYTAYKEAVRCAKASGSVSPPKHILNAPTQFMKDQGYNKGYMYDHDCPDGFSGQNYFPIERQTFYRPVERGFERDIRKRLEWWNKLRKMKNGN